MQEALFASVILNLCIDKSVMVSGCLAHFSTGKMTIVTIQLALSSQGCYIRVSLPKHLASQEHLLCDRLWVKLWCLRVQEIFQSLLQVRTLQGLTAICG